MDRVIIEAIGSGVAMMAIFAVVWIIGDLANFTKRLLGGGRQQSLSNSAAASKNIHGQDENEQSVQTNRSERSKVELSNKMMAGEAQPKNYTENISVYISKAPPSEEELKKAEVLAKYDKDIIDLIRSAEGLPEEVVRSILITVIRNPKRNIDECRNQSILHSLGRPDLVWNKELDAVISACKAADPAKSQEFFRAFPILSTRMSPVKVANRVIFDGREKRYEVYGIRGLLGGKHEVVEYVPGYYTLRTNKFGDISFTSLNSIFDYLKTPVEYRQLMSNCTGADNV